MQGMGEPFDVKQRTIDLTVPGGSKACRIEFDPTVLNKIAVKATCIVDGYVLFQNQRFQIE